MARKTVPVAWLIQAANARMIATPDAAAREALFWLADAALHEADQYRGFWYAHVAPDHTLHTCRPPEETAAQKADPDYRHYNNPAYRAWVAHADNGHLKLFYGDGNTYHATAEDRFDDRLEWLPASGGYDVPAGAGDAVEAYRG